MSQEFSVLLATAGSLGFLHTVLGPDHYLPFIAMSRAQKWSFWKTSWITFSCAAAHILSSFILGTIGIVFGVTLNQLEVVEALRGKIAIWFLIAFGLVYLIWGLRRVLNRRLPSEEKSNLGSWMLFLIFVFGPCEPLIPLLMYPAAKSSLVEVFWVGSVFGVVTISTMLGMVLIPSSSFVSRRLGSFHRYGHALAGIVILLFGLAVRFMG